MSERRDPPSKPDEAERPEDGKASKPVERTLLWELPEKRASTEGVEPAEGAPAAAPAPAPEKTPTEKLPLRDDDPPPAPRMRALGAEATLDDVVALLRRRALRHHGALAAFGFVVVAAPVLLLAALVLGNGGPAFVRPLSFLLLAAAAGASIYWVYKQALRPGAVELARRLEDRDPEAAGLATAVELASRLHAEDDSFSEELARAHVEKTSQRVVLAGAERAFDVRHPRRLGAAAALACGLFALCLFFFTGAQKGFFRLAEGAPKKGPSETRREPITGDIALTYIYPAHTGLQQRTVEGTNGEITGPVGTQVRIETRADRDVSRAFLAVDGAMHPLEVKGRQLAGTLLLQRSGTYHFVFQDRSGDEVARGPDIPIEAIADGVPVIDILQPVAELVVTEREAVELRFDAADDYGIAKVELVFRVGETAEESIPVASYRDPRRRADGAWTWELSTLKLRPGDVVTYQLRALDNDSVGGAKAGVSQTQRLQVFSEAEHRRALIAQVEESWEKMVLALGDRITPRAGPRRVQGAARIEAGAPADEQVLQVATELQDVGSELRADERAPRELGLALANISRELLSKSQTTRTSRARAKNSASMLAALDRAEANEQRELEKSVLYLEALLDRQRILQLEELAKEMTQSRQELANLLQQYRDAPDDAARTQIQRELERLKGRMMELMRKMAELSKGIQDEHLNAEAIEALSKERDLMGELDEVQRLLAEGKIDEALQKLEELGTMMDEMAQALSEAAQNQTQNDPALKALAEQMQKFESELQELAQDQSELADATERLRREQVQELQKKSQSNDLVEELRAKVERARVALDEVPAGELPARLTEGLFGARERLSDLDGALSVKDFDAAMESAAQALAFAELLQQSLIRELDYARRFELPEREVLERSDSSAATATPLIREVKKKLEELFDDPQQQLTPQQRQRMQQMAQRQQQLQQRMQQLQSQAQQIGEQAPIFDESAQQAMRNAQRSMGEAQEQLSGRNPGGALSAERRAQEELSSLQQSLEQARQQAQQGGSGAGFPMPLGGGGSGRDGNSNQFDGREKVAIPSADQYKAPEEYRKEILDAMKQESPAPFKEQVREYYEEIVK